jgi:nicotinamidase-related amidase
MKTGDFRLKKDNCGLLVIDMQRHFCSKQGNMYVPNAAGLIDRLNQLIETFRAEKRPVIFTRHIDALDKDNLMMRWWGHAIYEDDPMSEVIDAFNASPSEIIKKTQYDAFLNTDLEQRLQEFEISQLVITGVLTNICCESTARSAFMRGYEVYFCTDGTATYKKEMQEGTLVNLGYGFATLMTVSDVIKTVLGNR